MVKMRWMYYSLVLAMLLLILVLVWAKILFSDGEDGKTLNNNNNYINEDDGNTTYKIYFNNSTTMHITNNSSYAPKNPCLDLNCPSNTVYVGSINSDKYYTCDCRYAKRIKSQNIICFSSDEEALMKNYTKLDC